MTAAMLLLVLTAVLPTLAFFEVAHTIQVDSYIKYGQLTLAREVQRRLEQAGPAAQIEDQPRALERGWSRYGKFFYSSRVVDATETPGEITRKCGQDAAGPDDDQQDPRYELPKMLEDLLPYYSESSVGMRELLHDRSSDKAWDWHRAGARLVLHTPPNAGWNIACVRSRLPTFDEAGLGSAVTAGRVAQLAALSGLVLFAVFWIVRFTTRRIFPDRRHRAAVGSLRGHHSSTPGRTSLYRVAVGRSQRARWSRTGCTWWTSKRSPIPSRSGSRHSATGSSSCRQARRS